MKTVFTKIRNVKTPQRAFPTDAGLDFYIPEWSEEYGTELKEKNNDILINDKKEILIKPHCRILIPSGIKMKVPENHMFMAGNKSGIASKKGLIFGAEIIDEPYLGEWHINLINTTKDFIKIEFGQKIIQFICVPLSFPDIDEISENDFNNFVSERGGNGFGSTGIK